MAKVEDVAKKMLEIKGPMTAMKLQKLVFYAQAYSLSRDAQTLMDTRFEAWVNGPVFPDLYRLHRGKFMIWAADLPKSANSGNLTRRESGIVSHVIARLGTFSGEQLRELSHSERPWADARHGLSPRDRGDVEITQEAIKDFYSRRPVGNPLFA